MLRLLLPVLLLAAACSGTRTTMTARLEPASRATVEVAGDDFRLTILNRGPAIVTLRVTDPDGVTLSATLTPSGSTTGSYTGPVDVVIDSPEGEAATIFLEGRGPVSISWAATPR
jgi:hypothetical protein